MVFESEPWLSWTMHDRQCGMHSCVGWGQQQGGGITACLCGCSVGGACWWWWWCCCCNLLCHHPRLKVSNDRSLESEQTNRQKETNSKNKKVSTHKHVP